MACILILDVTTPKPYDATTLDTEPLGGTEATVIRIAEALSKAGHSVTVAQHCRSEAGQGAAKYVPLDGLEDSTPDVAIALRTPKALAYLEKHHPSPKRYLWCHDFNLRELVEDYEVIEHTKAKVLAVSQTHKTLIIDAFLTQVANHGKVQVDYVYNPVDDALAPDDTTVYQRKYVFFSSPHKGLGLTIQQFQDVRRAFPMSTLYVANPGYITAQIGYPSGVIDLGCLTHAEVIKHVREAFCVFNMNCVFPETFGLVFAEANAVGTPVLTAPIGAAAEVLGLSSGQLVDVRDLYAVIDRIDLWQRCGRPKVQCKPEFRTSAVIQKWESLING